MKRKQSRKEKPPKPKATPQPSGDAWQWLTRTQCAQVMGYSVNNIDKLTQVGSLTRDDDGRISLPSAFAYVRGLAEKRSQSGEALEAKDLKWRARYRKWRALGEGMRLKIQSGEYISRDEVNNSYQTTITAVRAGLAEWITRLPEKFSGQDVREIAATLDIETRRILEDLSAQLIQAGKPAGVVQ